MLIRSFVFVFLLVFVQSCNGLFNNNHQKDGESKMAERRWRRDASQSPPVTDSEDAQAELAVEDNQEQPVASARRRFVAQVPPTRHEPVEELPTPRRHPVITSRVSKTTTTTTAPSLTSTSPPTSPSPVSLNTNNPPPNTMSETLESYFRPIDLNVPQDHLRPFQEFGKKLTRGQTPSTTINTNTLEVTTSRPRDLGSNLNNRSNLEDELNEDMDVTINKPFTEQNKASSRPHHIMVINHGHRRHHENNTHADHDAMSVIHVMESLSEGSDELTNVQEAQDDTTTRRTNQGQVDSVNESNNVYYVQAYPPGTAKTPEERESNTSFLGETLPIFARENDNHNKSDWNLDEIPKNTTEVLTISIENSTYPPVNILHVAEDRMGTVKPTFKSLNRNATSFVLMYRRRGLVYGAKKNVTNTNKPKLNSEEIKVSNEDKQNDVTVNTQPDSKRIENVRKEFENRSKSQKPVIVRANPGEKQADSVATDQQVENTISKHLRGNVTYKSQLLKNSRTPKTIEFTSEAVAVNNKHNTTRRLEQLRQSTTIATSTIKTTPQSSEVDNPTSKILSTAVVTSISVLGEWTPKIPPTETDNVTDIHIDNVTSSIETVAKIDSTTPTLNVTTIADMISSVTPATTMSSTYPSTTQNHTDVLNSSKITYSTETTTPAIQTKESMRVSYSKNVPKPPNQNSTLVHSNLNQSLFISEVIKNLTSIQATTERAFVKDVKVEIEAEKPRNISIVNDDKVSLSTESAENKADLSGGLSDEILKSRTTSTKVNEGSNIRDSKSSNFEPVTTGFPRGERTRLVTERITESVLLSSSVEARTENPSSSISYVPVTVDISELSETTTESNVSWKREETTPYVTFSTTEPTSTRDEVTTRQERDGDVESTTAGGQAVEVTTSSTVEEVTKPVNSAHHPRSTKHPRVVNIGPKEKTKVVYHTEDVSSKPGQDATPDNDVAAYILGTFALIPIVIGALLTVRYCISRRKKIWESEKSPLTFVSTNEWEFPRSKLRLQTVLGQGNFGQVYKAEADDILGERATRLVAVKTIKDGGSAQEKEDLMRELAILKQIGAHSNVVTLLGCCTEKEPYYLILEYVMYGKLLSFLRDNRTRRQYYNFSEETAELTAKDLTSFAYCVARGMEYLTSKGIIHRDLAARNILVDHNKMCKVADFGMSRSVTDPGEIYEQTRPKGALPIRWMAPESLVYRVFTHKSDVWAFGILMWEIITLGSTPYQNMAAREVIKQVREGYRLERPDHCRPELYRVAARCWSHDPSKRPTFGEVKMELADLLEQGEPQTYVDLDSYIESISGSNTRTKHTTQVIDL